MMLISERQLGLLHHALGVHPEQRDPFRNHFVAGAGHNDQGDLLALVAAGMMVRARTLMFLANGDEVFICSPQGRSYALEHLPPAPKRTRYDEFLDADYGHSFAEWLYIDLPVIERECDWITRIWKYRYVRNRCGDGRRPTVVGEWMPTKKAAKASYKTALAKVQAADKKLREAYA